MKKQLLVLFLAFITGVGFYSCKKKYQVIPPPTPTSAIRDSFAFYYNDVDKRQQFSFNGLTGGDFVTAEGIVFHAPYYTFRDASGDTVLGTIEVEVIEILTPKEMLRMNKPTTSDGDVLVTGGQFKITFTVNDNPVFISADTVVYVRVPTDIADPKMKVFNGIEDATEYVNWKQAIDTVGLPQATTINQDTLTNGVIQKYYNFTLNNTSASWINCDYFYNVPGTKTGLTVGLPDGHNNSNTMFFIYFSNIQSLMSGYYDGVNFVSNGQIPVGTAVKLVFISEIDGDFTSKIVPITVSNGYLSSFVLDPTTYQDIEDDIVTL